MVVQRADVIDAYDAVLQVLSCKWAPSIFRSIEQGATRPGRMERSIDGISSRVLHRCLDRLEELDLVRREVFAEVPPHVEYALTDRGRRFIELLADVKACASDWEQSVIATSQAKC